MAKRLCELSALLDDVINLAVTEDEPDTSKKKLLVGTAGVGGVGAAGYGLYKRGQALGDVAGANLGSVQGTLPKSLRSKGVTKGTYSTAEGRGVLGNITAGAAELPSDVGKFTRQTAQRGSLLLHPEARAAVSHDIRASLAAKLAKLSSKIHP